MIVIVAKAFEDGAGNVFDTLTTPEAQHAFWLTLVMVAIAIPLNTIFGVACALVLVRHNFRGKAIVNGLIDLPFAISPVVIGLALVLVYGSLDGWFGAWLLEQGIRVIFTPVGMALATMFVSLPFVVREVEPVLREIGEDQEQAASTLGANGWQTFWRITLPVDPLGRDLRRRPGDGASAGRVRRGLDRLRPDLGRDRDAAAVRPEAVRDVQRLRRLRGGAGPGADRADDAVRDEPVRKRDSKTVSPVTLGKTQEEAA